MPFQFVPLWRGNDRMDEGLNSSPMQPFAVYTSSEAMENYYRKWCSSSACSSLLVHKHDAMLLYFSHTCEMHKRLEMVACRGRWYLSVQCINRKFMKRMEKKREQVVVEQFVETEMYRFPMPSLNVQIVAIALCAYECDRFHVWRCGIGKEKRKTYEIL